MAGAPRTKVKAMNASDIMTKDVVSVGPETLVRDAALLMLERRISGVPVVDAEQRVLGILSDDARPAQAPRLSRPNTDHVAGVAALEPVQGVEARHARDAGDQERQAALC